MLEITTCPTCDSKRIRRVRQDWKDEHQGEVYEVPSLEYFECPDCGEKVYDRLAMRKIEAHLRRRQQQLPVFAFCVDQDRSSSRISTTVFPG